VMTGQQQASSRNMTGIRRQSRRISKHLFTADSSEPQLLSLRRLCDDYRTSCLQHSLTARRLSLDRMLSPGDIDDVSPCMAGPSASAADRLASVVEDLSASIGDSEPMRNLPLDINRQPSEPSESVVSSTATEGHCVDSASEVYCMVSMSADSCTDDALLSDGGRHAPTYMSGEVEMEERLSDALDDSVGSCVTVTSYISSTTDEPSRLSPRCSDTDDRLTSSAHSENLAKCTTTLESCPKFDEVTDKEDCVGGTGLHSMGGGEHTSDAVSDSCSNGDKHQVIRTFRDSVYASCPATGDELQPVHDNSVEGPRSGIIEGTPACLVSASGTSSVDDLDLKHLSSSLSEQVSLSDVLGGEASVASGTSEKCEQHRADGWSTSVNDTVDVTRVLLNVDDEETWL